MKDNGNSTAARRRRESRAVWLGRLAVICVFIVLWEFLPRIQALQDRSHFFDPFFISSPRRVATKVIDLATGRGGRVTIWPYLSRSVVAALAGVAIGVAVGCVVALILSNSRYLARVFQPFIVLANATPRIALVPIVIILFGIGQATSIVVSVLVVGFVVFFNAFEGGTSVPPQLISNARLHGADRRAIMVQLRMPYIVAWTMAVLPIAIAFSLLSVVMAEVLTGAPGVGRLISVASTTIDMSLTLALVLYLAVTCALATALADLVKRRVLHWWAMA